jgi:serine/threonine protein kinase
MGELYLAHDPDLDREVAIKVMSEDIMLDEQARARFYREARAAARLQHRNIVTVFDFAHDGEVPYFVMEFLRGQNLSERLRQGPPLTLPMQLDLAIQLCEGLHFAHGEGVIHRDVKPANIWLVDDGGVKLLDFGIAKSSTGTLTVGSSVVGTAGYMSPEQIEGQPVDGRSDLFSVGAVLFELVTGRPPFDGDSVTAVMMKIVQDEPAPDVRSIAPDTPPMLATIVRRALEKAPDDRYGDAAQMAAELRAVRLEIAEQEERIEGVTIVKDVPLGLGIASHVVRDETAPTQAPTLVSPSKSPVIQSDDYDLRSLDEIATGVSPSQEPEVSASRNRRWLLIVGTGVAAAILVGFSVLLAWPQLPFNRPPQFRFTSIPEGANITVNGVNTGLRTPADLPLAQLPSRIRLELEGYEPYMTQVTEEVASKTGRMIRASLVALPPPPRPVQPEPTPPPPPRPLAELRVLRAPGTFAFCSAAIGRSWNGYPFDGVTSIRLPAQRYPIRIVCSGQPTAEGEIEVPAGKTERNFDEVVTLLPQESAEPR